MGLMRLLVMCPDCFSRIKTVKPTSRNDETIGYPCIGSRRPGRVLGYREESGLMLLMILFVAAIVWIVFRRL